MQAFKVKTYKDQGVYLYSLRNNLLIKESLEEEEYSLMIGAKMPVKRLFTI